MEYIYGTVEFNGVEVENLKTINNEHIELSGFIQSVCDYEDSTITDRCRIVDHYRSEEDDEGNCYDWYMIANHYRWVDKENKFESLHKQNSDAIDEIIIAMLNGGVMDD